MSDKVLLMKNILSRVSPQCRARAINLVTKQNLCKGQVGKVAASSVRYLSVLKDSPRIEITKSSSTQPQQQQEEKVILSACGTIPSEDDDDIDDEEEEMFVEPHASLGTNMIEWGGPRRGGRLAEPTRYGDWERKGRCTDF